MDDDQQGVHFCQELVAQGVLEEDPEENPEGGPAMGKDAEEARNELHLSKSPSDLRMVQKGDAYHLRSLEEEITNLKHQIFAAEARVVRAEKRVEVVTQEANELDKLLIHQLDDLVPSSALPMGLDLLLAI
ncbi:unnamed protein product [Lactuca saligna]|uniref:Uncharacterized protein n=1 Tax=Lactuca saligna TaxID=75948 RepID=A0AA36E5U0_LACSI|nr:unnamed protein product [Lactuca saligna]